ncbi:MAG: hypothetical protein U1F68_09155 [Gammaproteobacteria bacterium]
MSNENVDFGLMMKVLQEIQATQADHTRRFDSIQADITGIKARLSALEMHFLAFAESALPVHSRLDKVEKRLTALEEKLARTE